MGMIIGTQFGHKWQKQKQRIQLSSVHSFDQMFEYKTHQEPGHALGSTYWLFYPLRNVHFNFTIQMFTLTWKTIQLKAFMKRRGELWADVSPLPSRAQLRIERSREEHAQPAVPAWQTPPVKKHTGLRAHITTQCVIHTCTDTNTHTDVHMQTQAQVKTNTH